MRGRDAVPTERRQNPRKQDHGHGCNPRDSYPQGVGIFRQVIRNEEHEERGNEGETDAVSLPELTFQVGADLLLDFIHGIA